MSDMVNKMRHRRFNIRENAEVWLFFETKTSAKFKVRVDNVSLSGIAISSDVELSKDEGLEPGEVIPAGKIIFENTEYTLGRLVVRTVMKKGSSFFYGFSGIDVKMPVDSALSKAFDLDLGDNTTPFEVELGPDRFSLANFTDEGSSNVDLFSKAQKFSIFWKDWQRTARYSYENVRKPSMGTRVRLNKRRKDGRDDFVVMGSNDYLGLAAHPLVVGAAKAALDEYGFGSTGSPLTTGLSDIHSELSTKLSRMFRKQKVVLFNSGYGANIGAISSLIQSQDFATADMIAHASIQDGLQMAKGTTRYFKHNDMVHLERVFAENRGAYAGSLTISEGVFSMDGDVAPIDQIVTLSRKYKSRVLIDEAHSFGVIGPNGLGACERFGCMDSVDIVMGTFSKICGGIGGFIATSEEVANWMYFWARSHMFSVSIPPSTAAAALTALEIFEKDKSLLKQLRENITHFRNGLKSLGYTSPSDSESAIVPVVVGSAARLETMNRVFIDAGVFVVPIVYPAVSKTQARFRFTVMATHTKSDLDYVLNVLELALAKAKFDFSELGNEPKAGAA